ncbi:MAG: sensor histidine kinase [Phycisphaerales bacterium]|jgi:signal transduction histidine kinase|nr:HAMP domain-containing histidine kinase [Phycisphaeraceae bacterium]
MSSRKQPPPSIRRRLTRRLTALAAVTCALCAVGMFLGTLAIIDGAIQSQLVATAGRLSLMVEPGRDSASDRRAEPDSTAATPTGSPASPPPYVFRYIPIGTDQWFADSKSGWYFQVWTADGTTLGKSASLGEKSLPVPTREMLDPDSLLPTAEELEITDTTLPNGRSASILHIRWDPMVRPDGVRPAPADDRRITVAVAVENRVTWAFVIPIMAAVLIVLVLVFAVVRAAVAVILRSGLSSITRLSSEVLALDERRTDQRVATEGLPEEIAPLAGSVNSLLERMGNTLDRERVFSANAAHELRTPVAEIRAVADVGRKIVTEQAGRDALESVLSTSLQMEKTLESLLRLARQRRERGRSALIQIDTLVQELLRPHRPRLAERGISVGMDVPKALTVEFEAATFEMLIGNLLSNAAEYTKPGGTMAVVAQVNGGWLTVTVVNWPVDLTARDLQHVFEPFWRKDTTRGDGGHSGLGLPLVRSIAEDAGGTAEASLEPGTGFRVTVMLPTKEAMVDRPSRPSGRGTEDSAP